MSLITRGIEIKSDSSIHRFSNDHINLTVNSTSDSYISFKDMKLSVFDKEVDVDVIAQYKPSNKPHLIKTWLVTTIKNAIKYNKKRASQIETKSLLRAEIVMFKMIYPSVYYINDIFVHAFGNGFLLIDSTDNIGIRYMSEGKLRYEGFQTNERLNNFIVDDLLP